MDVKLDHKESWALKDWCFRAVVLEKTLESPLDCKEIQPVHPKENQPWILTGRTDAEAKALMLWPPDARVNSSEKTLMLGKIEGRRRRGWQTMRWLDGITDSMDMSLSNSGSCWWTGKSGVLQSMGLQKIGHSLATEREQSVNRKTVFKTVERYSANQEFSIPERWIYCCQQLGTSAANVRIPGLGRKNVQFETTAFTCPRSPWHLGVDENPTEARTSLISAYLVQSRYCLHLYWILKEV